MRRSWLVALLLTPAVALASVTVTVNGTNYTIPQANEKGWGQNVTSWIQAISANTLQPTGGAFTLTSDLDLGASFGIKSIYFKSRSSNIAGAGALRLASADALKWRNNANSSDIALAKNTSDQLTYAGTAVLSSAGVLLSSAFPALTGDVTTSAGSLATTVAKINGTSVSGTTGSTNVVFSTSPTITTPTISGTLTGNGSASWGQSAAGAVSVTIGTPSNATNSAARVYFQQSNTQTNWLISSNDINSGDLEFTPSTTTGGTTFTTPVFRITGSGTVNTGTATAAAFTSSSSNPASAGAVELASGDAIKWRNNANAADVALAKNTSDQLTWNGTAFLGSGGNVLASALPNPGASTLGGVESYAAVSHQWINSISTSGVPSSTQPACADLSNAVASCSTDTTNATNISAGTLSDSRLPSSMATKTFTGTTNFPGSTSIDGSGNYAAGGKITASGTNGFSVGASTTNSSTSTPVNAQTVASFIRFTGAATITLNGFNTGGFDGQIVYVANLTGNAMTITHSSGSATVPIALVSGTTASLGYRGVAQFIYDATSSLWRLVSLT